MSARVTQAQINAQILAELQSLRAEVARGKTRTPKAAAAEPVDRVSTCACGRDFRFGRAAADIAGTTLCALKGADMAKHDAAIKAK